jgi:hypothetical protein
MQNGRAMFGALLYKQLVRDEKRLRLDFDAAPDAAGRAAAYGPLMKCREAILRVLLYPKPPPSPAMPFMRPGVGGTATPMLIAEASEVPVPAGDHEEAA